MSLINAFSDLFPWESDTMKKHTKLKSLCTTQDTINNKKRQPTEWEICSPMTHLICTVVICRADVRCRFWQLAESGVTSFPCGQATLGLSQSFLPHWQYMSIPSVVPPMNYLLASANVSVIYFPVNVFLRPLIPVKSLDGKVIFRVPFTRKLSGEYAVSEAEHWIWK